MAKFVMLGERNMKTGKLGKNEKYSLHEFYDLMNESIYTGLIVKRSFWQRILVPRKVLVPFLVDVFMMQSWNINLAIEKDKPGRHTRHKK